MSTTFSTKGTVIFSSFQSCAGFAVPNTWWFLWMSPKIFSSLLCRYSMWVYLYILLGRRLRQTCEALFSSSTALKPAFLCPEQKGLTVVQTCQHHSVAVGSTGIELYILYELDCRSSVFYTPVQPWAFVRYLSETCKTPILCYPVTL